MIKADDYTSDCVYNTFEMNETPNFVENTLLEYERKNGANFFRSVKIKCLAKFLAKKTETKNFTIELFNIIGGVNKVMQSSRGMCKFNRLFELKIILQGRLYKSDVNAFLKRDNVPISWKKYFVKVENDRESVANRFV